MKIAKVIIALFSILSGLLICLFFGSYSGTVIPYPTLWYMAGAALVAAGIALLVVTVLKNIKEDERKLTEQLNTFKASARKIKVDLSSCIIRTNIYVEEVEKVKSSEAKFYDGLYDSSRNMERIDVKRAVLLYETEESGEKKQYYSAEIYKDEITIRFLLQRQEHTFIYVDSAEEKYYYFDIEFLNG